MDIAKNAAVYGPSVDALGILHGRVEPPKEMQALYGTVNAGGCGGRTEGGRGREGARQAVRAAAASCTYPRTSTHTNGPAPLPPLPMRTQW